MRSGRWPPQQNTWLHVVTRDKPSHERPTTGGFYRFSDHDLSQKDFNFYLPLPQQIVTQIMSRTNLLSFLPLCERCLISNVSMGQSMKVLMRRPHTSVNAATRISHPLDERGIYCM